MEIGKTLQSWGASQMSTAPRLVEAEQSCSRETGIERPGLGESQPGQTMRNSLILYPEASAHTSKNMAFVTGFPRLLFLVFSLIQKDSSQGAQKGRLVLTSQLVRSLFSMRKRLLPLD